MEEGRVGYKEYKDRGSAVGVGPERLRSSRRPEWPEQRAEGLAAVARPARAPELLGAVPRDAVGRR